MYGLFAWGKKEGMGGRKEEELSGGKREQEERSEGKEIKVSWATFRLEVYFVGQVNRELCENSVIYFLFYKIFIIFWL